MSFFNTILSVISLSEIPLKFVEYREEIVFQGMGWHFEYLCDLSS